LSHIEKIDLSSNSFEEILNKILDFPTWANSFINSLRDYNTENIDFEVDP